MTDRELENIEANARGENEEHFKSPPMLSEVIEMCREIKRTRLVEVERDRYRKALAVIVGECANMDEAVAVAKKALGEDTV